MGSASENKADASRKLAKGQMWVTVGVKSDST